MIELRNLYKSYQVKGQRHHLFRGVNMHLPANRNIALIGRNGSGKSTLLNMIGGAIKPDRGTIIRQGNVSWPMGFSGGFHPALTGKQNARFIARIYGADTDELVEYVENFAELGTFFNMPYSTYSSGMRARLAFGISMAARFDLYLVDEITAVGDAKFREKCLAEFQDRLQDSRLIMVSHSEKSLSDFCNAAVVVEKGQMTYYDDLESGQAAYRELLEKTG